MTNHFRLKSSPKPEEVLQLARNLITAYELLESSNELVRAMNPKRPWLTQFMKARSSLYVIAVNAEDVFIDACRREYGVTFHTDFTSLEGIDLTEAALYELLPGGDLL